MGEGGQRGCGISACCGNIIVIGGVEPQELRQEDRGICRAHSAYIVDISCTMPTVQPCDAAFMRTLHCWPSTCLPPRARRGGAGLGREPHWKGPRSRTELGSECVSEAEGRHAYHGATVRCWYLLSSVWELCCMAGQQLPQLEGLTCSTYNSDHL